MRYVNVVVVGVLSSLLAIPQVGCKASQTQINTAVQDIENVTNVISASAAALQADIAMFPANDQQVIGPYVVKILNANTLVNGLCKTYLSSPSSTVLGQISTTVASLATSSASALLNVSQIKDPTSQSVAQGILGAVATGVALLSGYLSSTGVSPSPATTAALNEMKPFMDRTQLEVALSQAKRQRLVDSRVTLAQLGF